MHGLGPGSTIDFFLISSRSSNDLCDCKPIIHTEKSIKHPTNVSEHHASSQHCKITYLSRSSFSRLALTPRRAGTVPAKRRSMRAYSKSMCNHPLQTKTTIYQESKRFFVAPIVNTHGVITENPSYSCFRVSTSLTMDSNLTRLQYLSPWQQIS